MCDFADTGATGEVRFVTLDDVKDARRRIAPYLLPTPLQSSTTFGRATGLQVFLKPENLQRTGSFKARGALNAVLRVAAAEPAPAGAVTASSGNHGQAVAFAAAAAGLPAVVVVPEQVSPVKLRAAQGYGAEIIRHGRYPDERKRYARQLAHERGCYYVDSTDDLDVIAGQGTIALEILEELSDVDAIVAPVGGGGLLSGVAAATKLARPQVRVIGVEPRGAAAMRAALDAGHPVALERVDSVADGLLARRPGDIPFAHVWRFADDVVLVDEEEILDAMTLLGERAKLVVEPSGAVGLAAALAGRLPGLKAGARVVVILTGGNVARDAYARWLAEPLRVLGERLDPGHAVGLPRPQGPRP